jgi:hypothetical protein
VKSAKQLDVDVLIEGAGKAIAGTRDHAPPSPVRIGERDDSVVRGIAQPKQRQRLERPVESDRSCRTSTARDDSHLGKVCVTDPGGKRALFSAQE